MLIKFIYEMCTILLASKKEIKEALHDGEMKYLPI